AALYAARTACEIGQMRRVILGTDSPAGSGVQPLGILRMIAMLAALGDIAAEDVFCFATGNTPKLRNLDSAIIHPRPAADSATMDKAQPPAGKALLDSVNKGDIPGTGRVIIDGVVRCQRSRNTPPAETVAEVVA